MSASPSPSPDGKTAGRAGYVIGIDVGGTFTDLTIHDLATGTTRAVKVPSDRAAPDAAVLAGLDKTELPLDAIRLIVHGTTVATNAILERRGSRAAFITTEGFRDVLELGRTTRLVPNSLYDPYFRRPPPLIPRRDRHVVRERVETDGRISCPLDETELEQVACALAADGVEAVVVGFVNAYANARHERQAAEILRRHFDHVTASTAVLNEIREFERFSVAAINGYVMPVMARYIGRLTDAVRERCPGARFYTVASQGGLLSTAAAMAEPVRTVLSGPAAGLAATLHLARTVGIPNLITYDMGGTSTDVALVADASFPLKRETLLEGLVIRLPQLDIHTVGAGGGSIAGMDAGGSLQVGPESAGAVPGPAAYGKGGTRPTVTDANVVLGRIGPAQELGRSLTIDHGRAVAAMGAIAATLSQTPSETAEAILRLAVARMAAAVHEISVARGFDPRDFALLSYGGAGPLHAALVAEEVGIPHVVVPPAPGAFSAFGALCSALSKDRSETLLAPLDDVVFADAGRRFEKLFDDVTAEFAAEGTAVEAIVREHQLDLRYRGQAHELTVVVSAEAELADVVTSFETAFERQFGRRDSDRGIELVNLRLVGRVPVDPPRWTRPEGGTGRASAARPVTVDGRIVTCSVWARSNIRPDTTIEGPAIVEEMSATTYVPPGWQLALGTVGQLDLVRAEGRDPPQTLSSIRRRP